MKKIAMALLVGLTLMTVQAAEPEWLTDLPKAQAKAKAENKMVLLDFTGSDWCGWCIKFKKEALDTAEFKEYADKNLVLVEVDFPRKKPQSTEVRKANEALSAKYKADGFPTFVVLSKDGAEIGRQDGYASGGAKEFIAKLDKFKKKN
ncbi:MAG: thioredoxin family protein [Verrucomicrobiota bacterium]